MRNEAEWACTACSSVNAGYRRRCLDCGERRPADATTPQATDVDVDGIPLPLVARRPGWRLGPVPSVLLLVGVLGLAGYGAASYVGAPRPSPRDDIDALTAAMPPGADSSAAVVNDRLVDRFFTDSHCPDVSAGLQRVLSDHATAYVESVDPALSLLAFDSSAAASRYVDLLDEVHRQPCRDFGSTSTRAASGRVVIAVEADDADRAEELIDGVIGRLELEG